MGGGGARLDCRGWLAGVDYNGKDRLLIDRRFALGIGEHDELTSAICAPALDTRDDHLIAIVDVWGPAQGPNRKRSRQIAPLVREAAVEIGRRMGQREQRLSADLVLRTPI